MSFESLLIHTVTITNRVANPASGDPDNVRYGNPGWDETTVESPARVQPTDRGEVDDGERDTRVSAYLVFLPAGTEVSATSTVEWEGRQHRVQGEPSHFDGMAGPHHIELRMEEVEG